MDDNSILHQVEITHFLFPAIAVQDPLMIAACKVPYHKHPLGCPNWALKDGCPPRTKLFLSLYRPEIMVAVARLNFAQYLQIKKTIHPDWTDRALRNPRHWQGHLRSSLKQFLKADNVLTENILITNPEAMGINVFQTCSLVDFNLEITPTNYVCQVYFLAKPK